MDLSGVSRGVVIPVRVDPLGVAGPTANQARGPRWRRSSRGLFVPAHVDPTGTEQRIVEAAAVMQDDWGGVTGWAGLAWLGARWFDGTPWGGGRPVLPTLAVGGNRAIRPQPTFLTSEERLAPGDLVVVDGLRMTTAVRCVCFEMRYARSELSAAIALSMAAYDDLVSIDEASAYAGTLNGWNGVPQCRVGIDLAVENAWSPAEVVMGTLWRGPGGQGLPLHNQPVFDLDGRHIGTPDLVDPVGGVLGQYHSGLHLARAQQQRDVDGDDAYRRHGLECTAMLAGDLVAPQQFLRRLAAAYDRAADIPASRRQWTIEQPDWWRDTTTVAARRALSPDLRARLLRYRAA
ncbi:MAG: hypothetical protein KDB43_09720 [Nocardioidaceae bacterium]|nr:hypothetical protein [Nocardioidaceae bacterium]